MPPPPSRPNILFAMVDDLVPRTAPICGHTVVQAPHLRRLARQGLVFEQAHTQSTLCALARPSMLAGQLKPASAA